MPKKEKWNSEAIVEHFSALREADQTALKAALAAIDHRLAGMNEFRETVRDISAKSLTRHEAWGFLIGTITAVGTIAIVWGVALGD